MKIYKIPVAIVSGLFLFIIACIFGIITLISEAWNWAVGWEE